MTDSINTEKPLIPTDGFSWKRVGLVWNYYSPIIRLQMAVYAGISLLFALLLLLPLPDTARVSIFILVWGIIPYLYQFAPCAFGRKGYSGSNDALLPATAGEKLTFTLIYFLIAVPLSIYLLPSLAELIFRHYPTGDTPDFNSLISIQSGISHPGKLVNIFGGATTVLICVYVVRRVRSNKLILGMVSVFVCQIAQGIIGAIAGGIFAFKEGYNRAISNQPMPSGDELTQIITEKVFSLTPAMIVGAVIFTLLFIAAVVINYRQLEGKKF